MPSSYSSPPLCHLLLPLPQVTGGEEVEPSPTTLGAVTLTFLLAFWLFHSTEVQVQV